MDDILFPYEKIRPEQKQLIDDVKSTLKNKSNLLVDAPTGMGKTIAVLGPALKYALDNNKTVFFLTSRHTQHLLAIDTLRDIKEKFNIKINCCDIIGKKWMCSQPNAEKMASSEFSEYCKALKEDGICQFYSRTRQKGQPSLKAESIIKKLNELMPVDTQTINRICRSEKLCPYEIAALLARESQVIISDYSYIFNERIRDSFFQRSGKKLEDSILIVDEGHNLPNRCRDMMSIKISNFILSMAIKEAKKFGYDEAKNILKQILKVLEELAADLETNEDFVLRSEFTKKIENYDEIKNKFEAIGQAIREERRNSFIGSIAIFLETWKGPDKGYCRTINIREIKNRKVITLSYKCLDPSFVSKEVVNNSISTIIMSGTLAPTEMYADLLGFRNYSVGEYRSPFSKENRLSLIIEDVTTKFTARNELQFKRIAVILSQIINAVPGNSIVFFPSYNIRDKVLVYNEKSLNKKIFLEKQGMSKDDKALFLENFKKSSNQGAVILAVAQGSFGEGIDLPGELLKCVVVVGIPLTKPDLETKELMEYYEDRYGEGVNYGYIYPAITKTLQNAGRCIRTEKDRGVIIFMDARYNWENYRKCFPADYDLKLTKLWEKRISKFFLNS